MNRTISPLYPEIVQQIGAVDFIAKNGAREKVRARVDTHITLATVKRALFQKRETLEERVR